MSGSLSDRARSSGPGTSALQRAIADYGLELALICVLFVMMCERVWNFGITHTDDASWALLAHDPYSDVVDHWAKSQGRVWAYPAGTLMLHALRWQGTFYGEFLRLGSFAAFFVTFHVTAAIYFGRRVALLAAVFFTALHVQRSDGSLLTTYPLFTWASGCLFLASVLLGRWYVRSKTPALLLICGLLLTVSLFNHEGVALLYAGLFALSIWQNSVTLTNGGGSGLSGLIRLGPVRRLCAAHFASIGVYLVVSLTWALIHPTTYEGHALGSFDPGTIARVAISFATSGSLLHDVFLPYSVLYFDETTATVNSALYRPLKFIGDIPTSLPALMAGVIALILMVRLTSLWPRSRQSPPLEARGLMAATGAGLIFAIVPMIPVALTARYQVWHAAGVVAYAHTIFSYFGLSLAAAGAMLLLFRCLPVRGWIAPAVALTMAIAVGLLAAIDNRVNEAIAGDMRPEAGRWRVLALALDAAQKTGVPTTRVVAPRFESSSWFGKISLPYWSDYARARYGADIRFISPAESLDRATENLTFLDYALMDDRRTFFVVLSALRPAEDSNRTRVLASRIVIGLERASDRWLNANWLTYDDNLGRPHDVRLRDLPRSGSNSKIRVLDNVQAIPTSIRIQEQPLVTASPVLCSPFAGTGAQISLATRTTGRGECQGPIALESGWDRLGANGVWNTAKQAVVAVQTSGLPPGDIEATFKLTSFTGLGFHPATQTVRVMVQGEELAKWSFGYRLPVTEQRVIVPERLRGENAMRFTFETSPMLNPKTLGINADDREYGIYLQEVTVSAVPAR